jgi:hypothetical protein
VGQPGDVQAARCERCEAEAPELYRPPPGKQLGPRPPGALCYFCFVRLVGTKPTRGSVVPR